MQCLFIVNIKKPDAIDNITIRFVLACIGRLCTSKCPRGYHRHQCIKICTCDADECGDESGCITTGKWMLLFVHSVLSEKLTLLFCIELN